METKELVGHIRKIRKPERLFAHINHTGPYMGNTALFTDLFGKVFKWASDQNLMNPDLEAITIYHDDPETVPAEKQRISVGVTVPLGTVATDNIEMLTLEEGDFAVGTFEIDTADYGAAWQHVMTWVIENNFGFALYPMYESYLNDPHTHPEGKHIVDICVPLK